MPYYKKNAKKPYNMYRKKAKKFSSKKKFIKPTMQKTLIKAPVNSRELFVKFPYNRSITTTVLAGGAFSYPVLGNSLIPLPAVYTGLVTTGDIWTSGITEYLNQYNFYRVLGCKIKLTFVSVSTSNVFRVVCVPVVNNPELGPGIGSTSDRITELESLNYDQLSSIPNATTRIVGIATGGNAVSSLKMFRKTKDMLGVQDLKDNINTQCSLPDPNGRNGSITTAGNSSWMYFVRIFNSAGASQTIEVTIRCTYYVQLTGRTTAIPLTVLAP